MLEANPTEDTRTSALADVVESLVLKFMINLNQRGYGTTEILDAFEAVCQRQRNAYDEDPDPAEDPPESRPGG